MSTEGFVILSSVLNCASKSTCALTAYIQVSERGDLGDDGLYLE